MPTNPNYRQPPRPPRPQQTQQNIPAWMQGNNASQYVSANVGQGPQPFTPGGPGTVKRMKPKADGTYEPQLQAPPAAPQIMSGPGTVKRLQPKADGTYQPQMIAPQPLTYTANPLTYTAGQQLPQPGPAWLQNNTAGGLYMPGLQSTGMQQPKKDDKPYRIQNPDGSWAYLQNDGSYLTATGTAGQDDIIPRNSFVYQPPFYQLPPTTTPPAGGGYSPFSSRYNWGRGGGGGGGGGYGGNAYTPAWMMGLNSWNFGE